MWLGIPASTRAMLLENVYCRHCRVTTIVDFRGSVKRGYVVLEGQCGKCGADVARLID
ncbi:MAG: hypothetical protein QM533_02780 [Cytophagales bacterium]|nr:hypothetical protein [Cytophagales bacterium]